MQQIDSVVQYDEFRLPRESQLPNEDFDEREGEDDDDQNDMEY